MTLPFAPEVLVERIGWLLVHSIWEFALIGLVLALALRVLRGASPGVRYVAALAGWGAMLIAPAATWPQLPMPEGPAAVAVVPAPLAVAVDVPSAPPIAQPTAQPAAMTPAEALEDWLVAPVVSPTPAAAPVVNTAPAPAWTERFSAAIAPWLNTLVMLWCGGMCLFAARSAHGWYVVRRLLHRDVAAVPDELTALLVRVARQVGLRHRVRLLQSPHIDVPVAIGWLRPVILLPVCVVTGFSPPQLEAILAHELAHIRRHDYLINLLQNLSETVFFYHPALWWASAVVRREREHCCDELAARALGDRAEYGRALLALEELRGETPTLALGAKGGSLLARIRRLAQREPTPRLTAGGVIGVAIVAALVVGAAVWTAGVAGDRADESVTASDPEGGDGISADYAAAVADKFAAVASEQKLPFLGEAEIASLRRELRDYLATRVQRVPSDEILQLALGAVPRRLRQISQKQDPYLRFRSEFDMLCWQLWVLAERRELTAAELNVREAQREWMRDFIRNLPQSANQDRDAKFRHAGRLALLESDVFNNPLSPFFHEPMSEAEFAEFQRLFKERNGGDASNQLTFAPAHFFWAVVRARYRSWLERYPPGFPLGSIATDDEDEFFFGRRPGNVAWGFLSRNVFDFDRDPAEIVSQASDGAGPASFAEKNPAIDLVFQSQAGRPAHMFARNGTLIPVNGARLATLDTNEWHVADRIPLAEIRGRIANSSLDSFRLFDDKSLPEAGPLIEAVRRLPILAVETPEGAVATLRIRAAFPDGMDVTIRLRPLEPNPPFHMGDAVAQVPAAQRENTVTVASSPDDVRATELARRAHAQAAAIDKLPKFYIHAKGGTRTFKVMPNAGDDPLENMLRDMDAPVVEAEWWRYEPVFAWDEHHFLAGSESPKAFAPDQPESKDPKGNPRSVNYRWGTRELGAARDEIVGRAGQCVFRKDAAAMWDHCMVNSNYYAVTPHQFWWGDSSHDNQTFNKLPPALAAYRLLPDAEFDGEPCHVVESAARQERLWISQQSGLIRGYLMYSYHGSANRFYETDEVARIAGRTFASQHEYGSWYSSEFDKLPLEKRTQLQKAWSDTLDFAKATPRRLIRFRDYREIASGVWWPFREDLVSNHASEEGFRTIRGTLAIDEVRLDLDLAERVKGLMPKEGEQVQDQRYAVPVNYEYRADRTEAEILKLVDVEYQKQLEGQETLKRLVAPYEKLVGQSALALPETDWVGGERPDVSGQPYLLHFWATWCGPCKNDLPILKQWADDGALIIGMHPTGTPAEEVQKAVDENTLNYPTFVETKDQPGGPGRTIAGYPADVFPYCVLVDVQGRVAAHGTLMADNGEILAKFRELRDGIRPRAKPQAGAGEADASTGTLAALGERPREAANDVDVVCVDGDGTPVAGAEVYVFQHVGGERGRYEQSGPFTTDAAGGISGATVIVQDADGHFDRFFYARVPGKLVGVGRSANWKNRSLFNPDGRIEMRPSQAVEGYVTVPPGADPTKITVRVQTMFVNWGDGDFDFQIWTREDTFPGLNTALPEIFERRPAADGFVQFADVPVRGRLTLVTRGDGYGEAQWYNREQPVFDKPIELPVVKEGILTGRVLSPAGAAVAGLAVNARRTTGHNTTFRAVTNASGEFTIRGLADTGFNVGVTDPQDRWVFRPQENVPVTAGQTQTLTLQMETGIAVTGRAVDEQGAPVEGAALSSVTESYEGALLPSLMTDAAGRYEFRLPAGVALLYFNSLPEGFAYPDPPVFKKLDVQPGQPTIDNGDIVLKRSQEPVAAAPEAGETASDLVAVGVDAESKSEAPAEPTVPMTTLNGAVVDESGNPAADVAVEAQYHAVGGPARVERTTDANGGFEFEFPSDRLRGIVLIGSTADRQRMAIAQLPWEVDPASLPELTLTLKPALRADVRVVDGDGQPVAGAKVNVRINHSHLRSGATDAQGAAAIMLPADAEVQEAMASKSGLGVDYKSWLNRRRLAQNQPQAAPDLSQPITLVLTKSHPLTVTALDAATNAPIGNAPVQVWYFQKPGEPDTLNAAYYREEMQAKTNLGGVATVDWIPAWAANSRVTLYVSDRAYEHRRNDYTVVDRADALTVKLHRLVSLSGRVTLPDGRPAPGIALQVIGEGYNHDSFRSWLPVKTAADGRYEVNVAPDKAYLVVVDDQQWAAPPATGFVILPGQPKEDVDFQLQPATRIFGRVTMGPDHKPIAGQRISSYQDSPIVNLKEAGVELPADAEQIWASPNYSRHAMTDADGRFELFVGPGKYDLRGTAQNEILNFEITTETEREFNFHSWRPEKGPFSGVVVAGDPPRPVPNAKVWGIYRYQLAGGDIDLTTDANGGFELTRELHATVFQAVSEDRTQAGIVEVGPDDSSVTITLRPLVTAVGRLIDGETNEPLANATIQYHTRVHLGGKDDPFRQAFGGSATTDDQGNFKLDRLVAGTEYDIYLVTGRDAGGFANQWRAVTKLTPTTPGETIELGDAIAKPTPRPYKRPTLDERIATAFHKPDTAAARYRNNVRDIRIGHLHMLMIVADPDAELTQQFFKLRYDGEHVQDATYDYWLLPLPLTGEKADDTREFVKSLGIDVSDPAAPVFIVIDEQEQRVATVEAADLSTDGAIDRQKVLDFLAAYVPEQLDGQVLLDEALARAKAENKRVFVQESATWCGPCWMLSRFIAAHRDVLEQDYIFVKLDHRWPHAQEIAEKLRNGEHSGIPWSAILDGDQQILATSDGPDGNIGFPSKDEPVGVEHFLKMLRDSRIRLTDAELESIGAALRE